MKYQPLHCHVMTRSELFTKAPLSPSSIICYWPKGADPPPLQSYRK